MDMNLDVTQVLVGYDGEAMMDAKPILDDKGKQVVDDENKPLFDKVPITLRPICTNALMAALDTDRGMSGEDKMKLWTLAGKIQKEDVVELTAAEVVILQNRIGTAYGAAIVGPAFMLLNGTPGTPKPLKLVDGAPDVKDHPAFAGVQPL